VTLTDREFFERFEPFIDSLTAVTRTEVTELMRRLGDDPKDATTRQLRIEQLLNAVRGNLRRCP